MARRTPAVQRSLDILELFLDGRDSVSAPEIVEELELPRTTVHELLNTLAGREYLHRHPDVPGRYQLGIQLFRLGSRYSEGLDVPKVGQRVAQEVVQACNETAHVAVLDGLHIIYIAKVDSSHAVRMVSSLGRRLPAHCTALGKALLASLPEAELDRRLEAGPLEALSERSITDPARLRAELDQVRREGWAMEECEANPDVCCVAAPVRDRSGQVVSALSISVPAHRWSPARRDELRGVVTEAADRFTALLGGAPAPAARPGSAGQLSR